MRFRPWKRDEEGSRSAGSSGDGMAGRRDTETDADGKGPGVNELVVDWGLRCLREKAAMCESAVLCGRAGVSMY